MNPQDQVWWYLKDNTFKQLTKEIKTEILVIGGGMAGLSAAQSFCAKGLSVVLIEKNYCGAGASGKSSGFVTPDSEFSLSDFINRFDIDQAAKLWNLVSSGVNFIENNINNFSLDCDYQKQATLVVANTEKTFKSRIIQEHQNRLKFNYDSNLYKENLTEILGSNKYYGGICYDNTFGISVYKYCNNMKKVLKDLGVEVYEETPAIKINNNEVLTPYGKIIADKIIICTDRFTPELNIELSSQLSRDIYHAQGFLMMSTPLSDKQINKIFPAGNLMVWDTELLYQYFRITDNNRLMIGGSTLLANYASNEWHNSSYMFKKLNNYFKKYFPEVDILFDYMWPGFIGISKDILPIAGTYENYPNIYFITACAGLPWAAALGSYSAENIVNNNQTFDKYFSPNRKFPIDGITQTILGTKLSFALSNFMTIKTF